MPNKALTRQPTEHFTAEPVCREAGEHAPPRHARIFHLTQPDLEAQIQTCDVYMYPGLKYRARPRTATGVRRGVTTAPAKGHVTHAPCSFSLQMHTAGMVVTAPTVTL